MNNKYKNVVIPVDLEHPSSWYNALPMAVDFARNNEATLHVITVAAQADIPAVAIHLPKDIDDQIISATAERLNRLVQQEVPSDIETLTAVGQGRIYKEVLRLAAKCRCGSDCDGIPPSGNHGLPDWCKCRQRDAPCTVLGDGRA